MFARHLPPSAGQPRVLALDPATAVALAEAAEVVATGEGQPPFDAIAGRRLATAGELAGWAAQLRPGGRLILAAAAEPETLLAALQAAGYIHCLVETAGDLALYRGERPPGPGSTVDRAQQLASGTASEAAAPRFLYLLVTQTPNKPAWKLQPGERVEWHAATLVPAPGQAPQLLAFTSLVKAVAFLQPAVLAGAFHGVTKVAKFPGTAAAEWPLAYRLNPAFGEVRQAPPGPPLAVAPEAAISGEE